MKNHLKIAITGAAGNIGYALLFRIASGQLFGPNTTIDLHLLDLAPAQPALEGIKMELNDCAFPLLNNIICTADPCEAFTKVNWALLVGAAPRKAGMERADLLGINGEIFVKQGRALNDHAADDVKILVVGNPCNTNAMIAMHNAPDIPNNHFFAMTTLDEKRAIYQLAAKANASVTDIDNLIVWGNHSATQFPDFYHAKIKGTPAPNVIDNLAWLQNDFMATVQKRGAAIIQARGASSAASAANAIIETVKNIHGVNNKTFSLAKCSKGEYGVDKNLVFSFPCRYHNGIEVIKNIKHNEWANEKFEKTLDELRQERDAVKALNLV